MNLSKDRIPYLDLTAHHRPLRAEIDQAIANVIDSNAFCGGKPVEQFESSFAAFCGAKHAIGVGSGTEALWLVLQAMGIGAGDEVITVPMTFVATAEAISMTGAVPVFVDIDPQTYTMDPVGLERVITSRTKAIIPVQLFGQAADMDPIMKVARARNIPVVEDAAQAHGATYGGRRVGTIGEAGCFSFYPGKNLGAFGDAGAVVTDNDELAEKMRMLREHGQDRKYHHRLPGWNCRMDGLQAAVLDVKLRHLERSNSSRVRLAAEYDRYLLGMNDIQRPIVGRNRSHVYHVYAIRVPERERAMSWLELRGIGHSIHYPTPIHLQEAYSYLGHRQGDFPVAEQCASEFLSLPIYPEMNRGQVATVVSALMEVYHEDLGVRWVDRADRKEVSASRRAGPVSPDLPGF